MFTSDAPIYAFRGPFGVPVQIAPSILLLVLVFVDFGGGAEGMLDDLTVLAIVLGSIFLHELGHAWGALIQGVPVTRIVMNGCGGFCQQERAASRYETELIVAMGPIVNLALWASASLAAPYAGPEGLWWTLVMVAHVNFWLAVINLLPVTPLDGSKLFFLTLSRGFPAETALRISGAVGILVAAVLLTFVVGAVALDPLAMLDFWVLLALLILVPALPAHWRMVRGQAV